MLTFLVISSLMLLPSLPTAAVPTPPQYQEREGGPSVRRPRRQQPPPPPQPQPQPQPHRHIEYMSFYGFDAAAQHGWINLGLEAPLDVKLDAWRRFSLPSLWGGFDQDPSSAASGIILRRNATHPRTTLGPDWEESLAKVCTDEIIPNFGPERALRGVFLGDENCCFDAGCWDTVLAPLASRLRRLLGPDAILYANECPNDDVAEIPPDLDLISVDFYAGYAPGSHGTNEVRAIKGAYGKLLPKLRPHQRALLVPGIFGCSNTTYFPLKDQSVNLLDKLDAYWDWAVDEPRIAGFNPWHYRNRTSPQHRGPCDMSLGAEAFPDVVAKLVRMGKAIVDPHRFGFHPGGTVNTSTAGPVMGRR